MIGDADDGRVAFDAPVRRALVVSEYPDLSKPSGVRFRDLLAASGPQASGTVLEFVSAEAPYVDTLTLRQAELHDAMLAYEMDGKPLPREHGAPVRVVIPEMYGYKNVKWVERIVLTDHVSPGFWEQRGYDVDAWVGKSNGY